MPFNNKGIECVFHTINRHYIRMKKKEKKENTDILFSVLEELLNNMRTCVNLFDSLKPKLDFLGSYFDKIRVGKPTEYDINVVLTFPINYDKIKLDATHSPHDYTAIIMPSEFRRLSKTLSTASRGFTNTQFWCDEHFRLSVTKFRVWMQSTIDHAINSLPEKDGKKILQVKNKCFEIHSKISGPANTIKIVKNDGTIIDVDLVPTFYFKLPFKPLNSKIDFSKVETTNIQGYFLVPKPNNDDFSWRISFPFQERYILKNKNNLKGAIRLIKHFRDVQGFTTISSYFIKTLFLWECQTRNEKYWGQKSLSYIVLTMLMKLQDCLKQNRIQNYWCSSHNLIDKIKSDTCQNWCNRISRILRDIDSVGNKNPYVVLDYFGVKKDGNQKKTIH